VTPFAPGVWVATEPVQHLGLRLTTTMALVRLGDGSLLAYSPVRLTPERRAAVDALGPVAHVYAPNTFHHLWAGEWLAAYPGARLHAPAGLAAKRPDLRIDRVPGQSVEPAFAGVVEELPLTGFRLEETVLFHEPSRTLISADLVHNIGRPEHPWTALYARMNGFYDRVALSRMLRWVAISDRAALRRSVEKLVALPFERVIVGHGEAVREDGRRKVARAYGLA
jgi:hypothetical protein